MYYGNVKTSNIIRKFFSAAMALLFWANAIQAQPVSNPLEEAQAKKIHPNDVSILYPLPESSTALFSLISIAQLTSLVDSTPVFPERDFLQMLSTAKSKGKVSSRAIDFVQEIESIEAWKIAGIRFDPSAPGASTEIKSAFGSIPQIRLVLQPVTFNGNQVKVHDVTIHAIYNYILPTTPDTTHARVADDQKVAEIISDLITLQEACEEQGESTSGPLSIHPCLEQPASDFHIELVSFLRTHLHSSHLQMGAIMGLNNGAFEPWIFVALQRQQDGVFHASPSPGLGAISSNSTPMLAQMISFLDNPNVQPQPSTTNTLPITANLGIQSSDRRGISTAPLFSSASLSSPANIGRDSNGNSVLSDTLKNADIVDWVANPEKSHFFNTDCVSCHSETTRREALNIAPSEFRFISADIELTVDENLMHADRWNVRNFGWFVSPFSGAKQTTITQRTANETFEVVEAINRILSEDG